MATVMHFLVFGIHTKSILVNSSLFFFFLIESLIWPMGRDWLVRGPRYFNFFHFL
jgi:hypothetical protein